MRKSISTRLTVRRSVAAGLALLLTVTAVPDGTYNALAATKKPAIAKKASVTINGTTKLTITKNGYKISSVKWKTSKKSVAKVKGTKKAVTIYGIKSGSAKVTATVKAKKNGKTKKFTLTTKVTVPKLIASLGSATLAAGEATSVTVSGTPKKAKLTYVSDNASVAAVSSKGTVTAAAAGTAKIKVKVSLPKTDYAKAKVKTLTAGTVTVKEETVETPAPSASAGVSAAPSSAASTAPSSGTSAAPSSAASAAPSASAAVSASPSASASASPSASASASPSASPSGGGGYSGGGSSSGGGTTKYAITVNSTENGSVTASVATAAKGATVTLTIAPAEGYGLASITAADASGNPVELSGSENTRTFTMPAAKVTVSATFTAMASLETLLEAAIDKVATANLAYTDLSTTKNSANWEGWTATRDAADEAVVAYTEAGGSASDVTGYSTYVSNKALAATIGSNYIKAVVEDEGWTVTGLLNTVTSGGALAVLPETASVTFLDGTTNEALSITWSFTGTYEQGVSGTYAVSAVPTSPSYEFADGIASSIVGSVTTASVEEYRTAAVSAIGAANSAFTGLDGTPGAWSAWETAETAAEDAISAYTTVGGEADATNLTDAYTTYESNKTAAASASTTVYSIALSPEDAIAYGNDGSYDLGTVTVTATMLDGSETEATGVVWSLKTQGTGGITDFAVTDAGAVTWTVADAASEAAFTATAGGKTADFTLNVRRQGTISYTDATVSKHTDDAAFTNTLTQTGDGTVTYASSDTNVATVNASTGEVTIAGVGTATITATVEDSATYTYADKTATYTLSVRGRGTISFASASGTKSVGDAAFANAVTNDGDGTVTYASDDTSVATVNASTGEVTIVGAGSATITATVENGEIYDYAATTATYALTVNKGAGAISYTTASLTKAVGDSAFTNELTQTGDGTVTYESDDTDVATVNASTGEVTIVGAGSATITATVTDSDNWAYATSTATYSLTVSE